MGVQSADATQVGVGSALSVADVLDSEVLAAELHDRVITGLTGMILEMEEFKRDQYNRQGVQLAVAGFQTSARSALAQLRDVVHGMQGAPAELSTALIASLRRGAVAELEQRTGAKVRIRVSPEWPRVLDNFTATQLFRIIEQALRNVGDHGRASQVRVTLDVIAHHLVASISDNGVGFAHSQRVKGQGLMGMEHRALVLGGSLEIRNRLPHGAILRVSVPLV